MPDNPPRMTDRRFNELLNGPLAHPLPMFRYSRLALALRVVVDATGKAGMDAFREPLPGETGTRRGNIVRRRPMPPEPWEISPLKVINLDLDLTANWMYPQMNEPERIWRLQKLSAVKDCALRLLKLRLEAPKP